MKLDELFNFNPITIRQHKAKEAIQEIMETQDNIPRDNKAPSSLDLLNIMPAKLHMNNADLNSVEFMQDCLKLTSEVGFATDILQQMILTYLIVATATQDSLENMTFYHIYKAIDNTLNLDPDTFCHAYGAGMHVIDITAEGLPEFLDVSFIPSKDFLDKIRQQLSFFSATQHMKAMSRLSLSLFQFCFAHKFLGTIGDELTFDDNSYMEIERSGMTNDDSQAEKNAISNINNILVCLESLDLKKKWQEKERIENRRAGAAKMYDLKNEEKTLLHQDFSESIIRTRKVGEPFDKKVFNSCTVSYENERYYFSPVSAKNNLYLSGSDVNIKVPQEIAKYLDKHILGQKEAKKAAATAYYLHNIKGMRQNMIFIGPSGCGKTEIFRQLSHLKSHTVYIYDAASISNDGWKGQKKYYSVFTQMLSEGWTKEDIENAIIVLDESDKMFSPKYSSGGDNVAASVQAEFLAMVEGTTLNIRNDYGEMIAIDTHNMSFIFLGAFSELRKEKQEKAIRGIGFNSTDSAVEEIGFEDLIKFGLCTELAGRISRIVLLDGLTENDFYTILQDPVMSPVADFAIKYREPVNISQKYLQDLSRQAIENEMGVRFMHGQIMDVFSNEVYSPGSTGVAELCGKSDETVKNEFTGFNYDFKFNEPKDGYMFT